MNLKDALPRSDPPSTKASKFKAAVSTQWHSIFVSCVLATLLNIASFSANTTQGPSDLVALPTAPLPPSPLDFARLEFCVSWDIDTDAWWTHHPEWFNLLNNETHTCFEHRTDEKAQFFMRLYDNQWNNDCNVANTRFMWNSGWGADFNNVVDGFLVGLSVGRPLSIANRSDEKGWHYAKDKSGGESSTSTACPRKDMFCYFLPLTNCLPNITSARNKIQPKDEDKYLFKPKYKDWTYHYITRQKHNLRKELMKYLSKVQLKVNEPCSAIHVRRSDVVLHGKWSRKYFSIPDYVNLLPENRKQEIIIFTDDANAIDEALDTYPKTNWHYINRTRYRGAEGGWERQTPSNNPKQETLVILAIFELAKRCDTFVYGSSNFAKLILNSMRSTGKSINMLRVDSRGTGGNITEN
mmetsp:Transcript_21995/g.51819  ORF Transcript_21995/g.51819 Transcript_21995/m.51819 type:complete len:410 (+) Transcript_21995:307-1536(+)|eukprot:CAMPEP_0113477092 /NCGR_PEP_ID=MMETSP0014_2-20120614/20022_1 /TAXON_ID=2857 /ORGANISM="Nitzschia sp." /LENGTH=409 /DNA_ID=CAMNT_0000370161 /DNA_START=231 /DNA_END=1460 /DNA_ORIENTATION=+ /assembly_acc=CAM_ASM_000159